MNNGQINRSFLESVDEKTKVGILNAIAKHYGISPEDAFEEVVFEDAEHLLDYLTGSIRSATSVLMQRHKMHSFV